MINGKPVAFDWLLPRPGAETVDVIKIPEGRELVPMSPLAHLDCTLAVTFRQNRV